MRMTMLAGLALAATALPADAADVVMAPGETLLEVQASGEAVVLPDAASISVGVVSTGATAREATAANATDMARVVAAIRQAGIDERFIRSQQISVQPRFKRTPGSYEDQPEIEGYVARNSVNVTVTKLALASGVIDAAFAAGANSVNGPNLMLQDDRAALDTARRDAIANARAEAATYAAGLGMRVARVIRVSERGQSAQPLDIVVTGSRAVGAPPAPPPPPVAGGEMRQTVNLWIDFALVAN